MTGDAPTRGGYDGGVLHTEVVFGVPCVNWRPQPRGGASGKNFGDELGPTMIRRMLATRSFRPAARKRIDTRVLSVGSILSFAERYDTIWGSGVNGKDRYVGYPHPFDVRAVRGPLTRAVLLANGHAVPPVYGDPALLVPKYFPEFVDRPKTREALVVPNLNDEKYFAYEAAANPRRGFVDVVAEIVGSEFVVASSLHALIIADAFDVPNRPLRSEVEHPFKYIDYYLSTGRTGVVFAESVEDAFRLGPVKAGRIDTSMVEGAFPWDLWLPLPEGVMGKRAESNEQLSPPQAVASAMRDALEQQLSRSSTSAEFAAMKKLAQFMPEED